MPTINIIFDGPPGPEGPRFIEVEDEHGRSVRVGRWVESRGGLWSLQLRVEEGEIAPRSIGFHAREDHG